MDDSEFRNPYLFLLLYISFCYLPSGIILHKVSSLYFSIQLQLNNWLFTNIIRKTFFLLFLFKKKTFAQKKNILTLTKHWKYFYFQVKMYKIYSFFHKVFIFIVEQRKAKILFSDSNIKQQVNWSVCRST